MTSVDMLRSQIDAGRTSDKVAGFDPAAAPLGTDEEAAGTPITSAALSLALQNEVDLNSRSDEDGGKGVYLYFGAVILISLVLIGSTAFFLIR